MNLYKEVKKFVNSSFNNKEKLHFERTVYWFKKFLGNLNEAQKIAAYGHDIERAFRKKDNPQNYLDKNFLKIHQERSAEIIDEFLKSKKPFKDIISSVSRLIKKHEVGGDEEQNALMDADSISFFETSAKIFIDEKISNKNYKLVKDKFDWMFNRISNKERKKLIEKEYKKLLKIIKKYE